MEQAKRHSPVQFICGLLVTAIVLLQSFPPFMALSVSLLLSLLCAAVWVVLAFCAYPGYFIHMRLGRAFPILYVLFTVIYPYLMGQAGIGNRYVALALLPFFYLAYEFHRAAWGDRINRVICWCTVPFFLVTFVRTFFGLLTDPWMARNISSSGELTTSLLQQGIGGYFYIYSITLFAVLAISVFYLDGASFCRRYARPLILVAIVACVLLIVLSNFFTALIMVVIACILGFLIKDRSIAAKIVLILACLLLLLFWKPILLGILSFVIDFVPEGRTAQRLALLYQQLSLGEPLSVFSDRIPFLGASLEGFLRHPLAGTLIDGNLLLHPFESGFGEHSQILDTLSLFGIWGFSQIPVVVQPFWDRRQGPRQLRVVNICMLSLTLLLFLVDTVTPSIGYVAFFVFPTVYDYFSQTDSRHPTEVSPV